MKTVLILTYYWPPAGGPGVQRVLKFAKYLPQFGWSPVILTVKKGEYPAIDETLLKDVPEDLIVYKTPTLEPFALYRTFTGQKADDKITTFVLTEDSRGSLKKRLAASIRGNLFIPDARIGWKPFAVKAARRIIRDHNIDLIFSTAPPMSTHLIAKEVAKKSQLPWVADFRDPWTDVFYYHKLKRSKAALALDKRYEASVLQSADAIVTVSPTIVKLFEQKVTNHYFVIPNGYDAQDFHDIDPLPDDGKFHMVHAGHLAGNQNPTGLWQALQNLIKESSHFQQKLHINFYGSIHTEVHRSILEHGLEAFASFHQYIPHDKLVAVMKRAALLFFVVPETSYAKGIPTSKLFDYMGAGRPILGIGPEHGDAAEFVSQSQTGRVIENKPAAIKSFILSLQKNPDYFCSDQQTEKFTRKVLSGDLAEILLKIRVECAFTQRRKDAERKE